MKKQKILITSAANVLKTFGDNRKVIKILKRFKFTNYKVGVENTVKWYKKNSHLF